MAHVCVSTRAERALRRVRIVLDRAVNALVARGCWRDGCDLAGWESALRVAPDPELEARLRARFDICFPVTRLELTQ